MRSRAGMVMAGLGVLAAAAVVVRLLAGGSRYGGVALGWPSDPAIVELRVVLAAAGGVVGGSLALAGAQLQSLLRNPLASPDLLGMSAGAGLALVVMTLVTGGTFGASGAWATAGSLLTLAVVYLVAQRRGLIEPVSLVLVGVIVAVILAAGTLGVQSLMPRDAAYASARWMLGGISPDARWWEVVSVGGVLGVGLALSVWRARLIDAAAFGDDESHALGVPLGRVRLELFVSSGVLTAGCVVLAGPVGFVGLVCPHVVRLLLGPAHRGLAVGSVLCGSAMLLGADVLVELIVVPTGRLPIGVLTALIGGPVFLVLLRRRLGGRG